MMDLATLQAFAAVADQGSFSRAADTLFLSQSAVSKRVSLLETDLRTRLFDRIGRRVRLTEAGEALLPRARRVLAEMENARQAVSDLEGAVGGHLRIGTSHHIGLHRLPPVLRAFVTAYPEVELDLRFMDSEEACTAVERGELELAIVTLPRRPAAGLDTETLWHDPLAFVSAVDHPLARAGTLAPRMLADEPAILPAPTTFTRRIVTEALRPHGVEPRAALETNYLETIKMMVSVGLGWSVLPRSMHVAGELVLLDVDGIRLERRLGLVRRAGRTLGNAARELVAVARTHGDSPQADDLA